MEANRKNIIIQLVELDITGTHLHEIKASLDSEYKYLIGIALSDEFASTKSILESVRLKGRDVVPEGMEAIHVMSSSSVAPDHRFFTLFKPQNITGDEINIKFSDPLHNEDYTLQVHLLLSKQLDD